MKTFIPNDESNHYQLIVDKNDDNKKIRDILINRGFSSRLITSIKKNGELLRNDEPVFFKHSAREGDRIDVYLPEEELGILPVKGPIDIVYEDSEVLVVNKPTMMVVHPTHDYQENTLANFVAQYFLDTDQKVKVRFVNRLDRDTTGLVIIAKNQFVQHYIQSQMMNNQVKKTYTAFVEHIPESESALIDLPIYRPDDESIERIIDERGKASQTEYKIKEKFKDSAKIECRLITGRTHQIRVHMKAIGNPLIGDPLYNPDSIPEFPRQALHAQRIEFNLPKSGRNVFEASLSEDLIELENELRKKDNESE